MACSWSKQPVYTPSPLNVVNDAVVGGQLTTVPNGVYASQGEQTLPGDHLVLDDAAAQSTAMSRASVGTLYGGYFQYVQLDPAIAGIGAVSQTVTITAAGTGYVAATTTVTFSAAPAGGTTATGVAQVSATGTIVGITVTNQGSGYVSAPTITIGGAGASATATAALQAASPIYLGQTLYWKNPSTTVSGQASGIYTVTNVQGGNFPVFAGSVLNPSWTPGYWGWIQNLGRMTLLVDAAAATFSPGTSISLSTSTGTSNGSVIPTSGTFAANAPSLYLGTSEVFVPATPTAGTTALVDVRNVQLRF